MSDVRDTLSRAAGTPVAPLDLGAVRARAARRRRTRHALVGLSVAAPVLALGAVLLGEQPGGSDVLVPASAPPAATATRAPSTPSPQALPDGTVYGLLTASDGRTVTWDQVDPRSGPCRTRSEAQPYRVRFLRCWSNTNPRLRTAPLDPAAPVLVTPGNDPERTVGVQQLPQEISSRAHNDEPVAYRVWRLTLRAGRVVRVEQTVVPPAS